MGPEAVVTYPLETAHGDMLKESADEFVRGQAHRLETSAFCVTILEQVTPVFQTEDAASPHRPAEQVTSDIGEDILRAFAAGAAERHPVMSIESGGQRHIGQFTFQRSEVFSTEEPGQSFDVNEEVGAGPVPGPVFRDGHAGHQAVHVRMPEKCPGPGMKYGQDPDPASAEAWIHGQFLQRVSGGPHQQRQRDSAMPSSQITQFGREREDHVEIAYRKQLSGPAGQPVDGLAAMASGARPVSTAIVHELPDAAGEAVDDLAPQFTRAAGKDVLNSANMRDRDIPPESCQIAVPVTFQNIDYRQHTSASEAFRELLQRAGHPVKRFVGHVCVNRGGLRVAVSQ